MTRQFIIFGAGMAGLLAAAVLRNQVNSVIERQTSLPNNHSALLRFRSSIVGDAVNVPFRPVRMVKAVAGSLGNPIADAVAYGLKATGLATSRSILSARGEVEERFIAPPDFIRQLADKVGPIDFGVNAEEFMNDPHAPKGDEIPIISTLPMPVLMNILKYEGKTNWQADFMSREGATLSIELAHVDLYATLYLPSRDFKAYRASITGSRLIIEYSGKNREIGDYPAEQREELGRFANAFGLPFGCWVGKPEWKEMQYSKILPIDETLRRRFILWASENHGVYSLGRFATWRPGLLLDDLVNDIRVIQRIEAGSAYEYKK